MVRFCRSFSAILELIGAICIFLIRENCATNAFRGHPYMTSALKGGGGVSPKEDVVREVA